MPLLSLIDASLQYSEHPIFERVNLAINKGERIAIMGRNGAGKSSLLKILSQQEPLDDGKCILQRNATVAYFQQTNTASIQGCVLDYFITLLEKTAHMSEEHSILLKSYLTQLSVDPTEMGKNLSGGQAKRAWLAYTLAQNADILCLDEPTNHLDIATIQWLTQTLQKSNTTLLVISHDRQFLQDICQRYIEIDRANIRDFQGDFKGFCIYKENELHAEHKHKKLFDKKLAAEETWVRQGIKARRTRNEGRVRELEKLRREKSQQRAKLKNIELTHQTTRSKTKEIIKAKELSAGYNAITTKDFSTIIHRSEKIALVGSNGCGKTTLIRTLLGEIKPLCGTVSMMDNLKIAYFDQAKKQLDESQTIMDFVSQGRSHIALGNDDIHVIGYLNQFLFSHKQTQAKISSLSGGEKNRVLLAYILSFESDILVLDEPTNDLDLETLETLENYLLDSNKTLLITSHDRYFINAVVDRLWVFQPDQSILNFQGNYDEWQHYTNKQSKQNTITSSIKHSQSNKKTQQKTKLNFKEKYELEQLPEKIAQAEQQANELQNIILEPDFYKKSKEDITATQQQVEKANQTISELYDRWQQLTEKQESLNKNKDN